MRGDVNLLTCFSHCPSEHLVAPSRCRSWNFFSNRRFLIFFLQCLSTPSSTQSSIDWVGKYWEMWSVVVGVVLVRRSPVYHNVP